MPLFYDPTYLLLIPAMLVSFWAQMKVNGAINKYSNIRNQRGYSGADVARQLLIANGIDDVKVVMSSGRLTDNYNPLNRVLSLSGDVYNGRSIASLSIAAHETGHAVQHFLGYAPLSIRSGIFPVVNICSSASMPIFLLGLFMGGNNFLIDIGIFLFLGVVIFQLITLPVEFNASKRAIAMLENGNYLYEDEVAPAKKVLSAAAMTYVASAFMAVAQLLRLILMSNRRSR